MDKSSVIIYNEGFVCAEPELLTKICTTFDFVIWSRSGRFVGGAIVNVCEYIPFSAESNKDASACCVCEFSLR